MQQIFDFIDNNELTVVLLMLDTAALLVLLVIVINFCFQLKTF